MLSLQTSINLACPNRRVLELFAGIGGVACVWPEASIVAAIDINQVAARVYRENFAHRYLIQEIESLSIPAIERFRSDFWWLSPPCQPFSRRGKNRDLGDPRTRGLLRIIEAIGECLPDCLGLENVVGFEGSRAHANLQQQLERHGYEIQSRELCPTQLNWPNRRPRFYLLASRGRLLPWQPLPAYCVKLSDMVDQRLTPQANSVQPLLLSVEDSLRYHSALDRVESSAMDTTLTACFAASYGKTILRAGSYLECGAGYRRFSPREVARLLGFPDQFRLSGLSPRAAWRLLGNSLSLPAVRYILSHVPAATYQ